MGIKQLENLLGRWLAGPAAMRPGMFVVGGAVRDTLLGRIPKDVDIVCVDAQRAAREIANSCRFRATVVRLEKKPHPPCFRLINPNDPSDFIDVVQMRSGSIDEDLAARDFTINAIGAMITAGGKIGDMVDPFDGQKDLKNRLLKTCSKGAMSSDPLRILRAARFAATLGFTITDETIDRMAEASPLLVQTASERITTELFELLKHNDSFPYILLLDSVGALETIFPEITAMKNCRQDGCHHLDVWNHCLETFRWCELFIAGPEAIFGNACETADKILRSGNHIPMLKLAALFHDSGKPSCAAFDPGKKRHVFYNHPKRGHTIAQEIAKRMKFSNTDRKFFCLLVEQHMRPWELSRPGVRGKTLTRWFGSVSDDGLAIILLACADMSAKSGKQMQQAQKERFFTWARQAAQAYQDRIRTAISQKPLVSGHDLMAIGIKPGPDMGRILDAVRQEQYNGLVTSREEGLNLAKKLAGL